MRSAARQVEAGRAGGGRGGLTGHARPADLALLTPPGMSYHELDERLENDPNIIICWK